MDSNNLPTRIFLFFSIFILASSASLCQTDAVNIQHYFEGNTIVVTYEIELGSEEYYDVDLKSSFNGYSAPLIQVSGDVGERIKNSGERKSIIWRYEDELNAPPTGLEFRVELSTSKKIAMGTGSEKVGKPKRKIFVIGAGIIGASIGLYFLLKPDPDLPPAPPISEFN